MQPLYEFPPDERDPLIELHLGRGKIVDKTEGSFGDVFFLQRGAQKFVAKCPRISKFGRPEDARKAVEKAIYEIESTARYLKSPGVHRLAPPTLVLGWPFFVSQRRDGTMRDLLESPNRWSNPDRLAVLIQIAHVLNYCRTLGLIAHQDLKPENILFTRHLPPPGVRVEDVQGCLIAAHVADFGIADAFRHIGQNSGSRPYMAPEQFTSDLIVDGSKIDVFALGVIAFEAFTGGLHPIGECTSAVWPTRAAGKTAKWDQARTWRRWAEGEKDLSPLSGLGIPGQFVELLRDCLAADPAARPDMETVENRLWLSLIELDKGFAVGVRMQVEANLDASTRPRAPSWCGHIWTNALRNFVLSTRNFPEPAGLEREGNARTLMTSRRRRVRSGASACPASRAGRQGGARKRRPPRW